MEFNFQNKTILVTGAGQGDYLSIHQILYLSGIHFCIIELQILGIGNELCRTLTLCKAKVIAVSRSIEPLQTLKDEYPEIEIISVDLSDWLATTEALKDLDSIDGLVNNAGIAIIKPFADLTEKDIDEFVL